MAIALFSTLLFAAGFLWHSVDRQFDILREVSRTVGESRIQHEQQIAAINHRLEELERTLLVAEGAVGDRDPQQPSAKIPPGGVRSVDTPSGLEVWIEPDAWVTQLANSGPPFFGFDQVPEVHHASFPRGASRVFLGSFDGKWLGEFEISDPSGEPIRLRSDEIALVRDLAIAYHDHQRISTLLVEETVRSSTLAFNSQEAAAAELERLSAAEPADGPGWFLQPRGAQFVICSRAAMTTSTELSDTNRLIEALVEQLGGSARVRAHGMRWILE